MWQVWRWIKESRDANYSNPEDFPVRYASTVLYYPLILTPLVWPAYILDSRIGMAHLHILLAIFNIVLLITVMPAWRRKAIIAEPDSEEARFSAQQEASVEEQLDQVALEIKVYVEEQQAFLDSHLKIDDVVEHCQLGRTYVSLTFQRRFGSFASYVNGLRLAHYEKYATDHPDETKESAAIASGFSNYMACYRAKQKQNRG